MPCICTMLPPSTVTIARLARKRYMPAACIGVLMRRAVSALDDLAELAQRPYEHRRTKHK